MRRERGKAGEGKGSRDDPEQQTARALMVLELDADAMQTQLDNLRAQIVALRTRYQVAA